MTYPLPTSMSTNVGLLVSRFYHSHSVLARPSFLSSTNDTMRYRVEVIKGGGTQQAMDAAQHRSVAADRAPSALLPRGGNTDGSSCPQEASPVSSTEAEDKRATKSSKSRRGSEHMMALRRLERFYRERRGGSVSELFGQEEQAGPSHAVMSGTTTVSAAGDGNGGTAELPEAGMNSGDLGNVRSINPTTNAFYSRATTSLGAGDLTRAKKRESKASGLLRSRPTTGGRMSLRSHRRWSQSDQRVTPRQRKKTTSSGRGEDVQRLLLRAMVGYDWVDDFNGRERRLRGVFTERDVGILEVGDKPLLWETGFLGGRRGGSCCSCIWLRLCWGTPLLGGASLPRYSYRGGAIDRAAVTPQAKHIPLTDLIHQGGDGPSK